jgi:ABC-type multidrug transport system fused ATPase/permease subunit
MALNQLQYLPAFDTTIRLNQGRIEEAIETTHPVHPAQAAPSSLVNPDDAIDATASATLDATASATLAATLGGVASPGRQEGTSMPKAKESTSMLKAKESTSMLKAEVRQSGGVGAGVVTKYIASMGNGLFSLALGVTALCYGCMAASDNFLAHWVERKKDENLDDKPYALVYGMLCFAFFLLSQLGTLLLAYAAVRASRSLHQQCLVTLLHAPLAWYDHTPSGRILSRFSADLSAVDIFLPSFVDNVVQFFLTLVALSAVLVVLIPPVAAVLVFAIPVFVLQTVAVDRANREVKRMANEAMAPMLSTIGECVSGRSTIAVMRLQGFFTKQFYLQVDEYLRYNFVSSSMINWGMLVSYGVSIAISSVTAGSYWFISTF